MEPIGIFILAMLCQVYSCAANVSDSVKRMQYASVAGEEYLQGDKLETNLDDKVYFDFDKSALDAEDKNLLEQYLPEIKKAKIVRLEDWKNKEDVNYLEEVTKAPEVVDVNSGGEGDSEKDEFYDQAVAFVLETRRASISAVQRKFRIGYNRAARLIEAMEDAGLVSEMNSNGNREVLAPNANAE